MSSESMSSDREALIAQVAYLHTLEDRIAELEGALAPFIRFHDWLAALNELGEFHQPLQPNDTVCQFSGGGGSDALHWFDFERAAQTRPGE